MKLNPTFTQSLLKFEMDQFYLSISQWQTLVLHYHGNCKLVSFSEVKAKNLIHLSYSQLITHFD